jgi:hypothetical protein
MKSKFWISVVLALAAMASPLLARPAKEKMSAAVYMDDGDNIAVEVKTVGSATAVLGSTVIAGQDIRSFIVSNPSRTARLGVSSGTTGGSETTFYLNTTTETASAITLTGGSTFYLKMETGANQSVPILRTYNSGK